MTNLSALSVPVHPLWTLIKPCVQGSFPVVGLDYVLTAQFVGKRLSSESE